MKPNKGMIKVAEVTSAARSRRKLSSSGVILKEKKVGCDLVAGLGKFIEKSPVK
jgi:hypothetical protein